MKNIIVYKYVNTVEKIEIEKYQISRLRNNAHRKEKECALRSVERTHQYSESLHDEIEKILRKTAPKY